METQYLYCPDYQTFVKFDNYSLYFIKGGELVYDQDKRFLPILIGEIYTEDITKKEFEKHLYDRRSLKSEHE